MGKIFETLKSIGVTSEASRSRYAVGTRDREDLLVERDAVSGVIFIDDFYAGDETYEVAEYREKKKASIGQPGLERMLNAERRMADYRQFVVGREVLDFGSGQGGFIRLAQPLAKYVYGVELEARELEAMKAVGIDCGTTIPDRQFDTLVCFHVLEHLPEPVEMLQALRRQLRPGGVAVFEVPHARDFLFQHEPFKKFTLWSQHLVLHTRESLRRILEAGGFGTNIVVQGKQRYPLSNHMQWLLQGKPGGHKSQFSAIDSPQLHAAYEAALQQIDQTDTIVAICSV